MRPEEKAQKSPDASRAKRTQRQTEAEELRGCLTTTLLILLAIVTASVLWGWWSESAHQAAMVKAGQEAARLTSQGLILFDRLDEDGDGLLFEEELRNAVLEGELSGKLAGNDLEIARSLYKRCQDIGHSVGRYRNGKFHFQVWAISKVDLKLLALHPDRLVDQQHGCR